MASTVADEALRMRMKEAREVSVKVALLSLAAVFVTLAGGARAQEPAAPAPASTQGDAAAPAPGFAGGAPVTGMSPACRWPTIGSDWATR